MTLVIGIRCKDGVIVGADRLSIKIRATRIKSYISKVTSFNFPDGRIVIVGHAGNVQDSERALTRIDAGRYSLQPMISMEEYLEEVVEPQLSRFYIYLKESIGREPDFSLVMAGINPDQEPVMATVYANGSFDIENYSTMGVGAPFAELILKDVNVNVMDLKTGIYLIGTLIVNASLIHTDIDGVMAGMDILAIDKKAPKKLYQLNEQEFDSIFKVATQLRFGDLVINKLKEYLGKDQELPTTP